MKNRSEQWISWHREHEYSCLYVGETYISMYYSGGGYEGGMKKWKNSTIKMIYSKDT